MRRDKKERISQMDKINYVCTELKLYSYKILIIHAFLKPTLRTLKTFMSCFIADKGKSMAHFLFLHHLGRATLQTCCPWSHGLRRKKKKKLSVSVAVPPAPVRVPSQMATCPECRVSHVGR